MENIGGTDSGNGFNFDNLDSDNNSGTESGNGFNFGNLDSDSNGGTDSGKPTMPFRDPFTFRIDDVEFSDQDLYATAAFPSVNNKTSGNLSLILISREEMKIHLGECANKHFIKNKLIS